MKKSIFRNALFKFLLNLFNLIVPILIGPYVLRTLGPEIVGSVNFSEAIYAYFVIFASFGVYQYGLREVSKVKNDREKLSGVYTSLFIITLISNVVTTIIYLLFIVYKYQGTPVYSISIVLTCNLISNIFYTEWMNEALENFDFIAIKTILIRIIYVVLLISMVKTSNNLNEYLILLVLSNFLNNIISFIYVKRKIKFNFKYLVIKKNIRPMILVIILSNANVLYTQLDRLMLGEYINTTSVAYYTMAQNITNIISILLLTVIQVTIPRLTAYSSESDKDYNMLLNKSSQLYSFILFPAAIGMFLLSKEIVLLYGGAEYIDAVPIMAVFSLYIISLGYESILSNQVMYINNKEKKQVFLIFICGAINLILNSTLLILGKFSGVTAIITTMISNFILILLEHSYIKYKMKIKFNIFSIDKLKYLLVALIFIPVNIIIHGHADSVILTVLLNIFIDGAIYFIILLSIKDKNMFLIINKGLNIIRKKTKRDVNVTG